MKKILSVLLVAMMVCAVALPAFATEASFTVFSDEEYDYYYFDMGSSNSGGSRFHDGWNYIIYELIWQGFNVNFSLIFSDFCYEKSFI